MFVCRNIHSSLVELDTFFFFVVVVVAGDDEDVYIRGAVPPPTRTLAANASIVHCMESPIEISLAFTFDRTTTGIVRIYTTSLRMRRPSRLKLKRTMFVRVS